REVCGGHSDQGSARPGGLAAVCVEEFIVIVKRSRSNKREKGTAQVPILPLSTLTVTAHSEKTYGCP
ncbi:hypothetical protein, partial [Bacillus pumilus]|uniref:hypothetical protein n=1 Tax=Bacillus pumilus TaxID=1408 RepID=UPI001C92EF79